MINQIIFIMYKLEDFKIWKESSEKKTYRYSVSGDKWIYIELQKDHIAGEHYHKGEASVKNPEILILLKGKIEVYLKHIKTNESERFVVEGPKIIKIEPYVYHEVKALEDTQFLEPFNEEGAKDRYEL